VTSDGSTEAIGSTARVSDWVDKAAIREVVEAYFDAASRGDWDLLESLFAPDARYEIVPTAAVGNGYDGRFVSVGPREIRESSERNVSGLELFVQGADSVVVTVHDDGRATARTLFHAIARPAGGAGYAHSAIYYDELVKVDDVWRFTSRVLQSIYSETDTLPGSITLPRGDFR
jgi:ketosteroid isomerase-like protein